MQIQFVGIMVHAFQLFFIECDYPIVAAYCIVGQAVLFIILFSQFYWKNYIITTLDRKTI